VYVDSCHVNVPVTHVCGLVGRTHMGNAARAYVFKYVHLSSICIFCAIMPSNIP